MSLVQPSLFASVPRVTRADHRRIADQRTPLPRCCSNCWRMGTRLDSVGEPVYTCLDNPRQRKAPGRPIDVGVILEPTTCPDHRRPDGMLLDGIEEIRAPERAARYAEQILMMEEWNRGH